MKNLQRKNLMLTGLTNKIKAFIAGIKKQPAILIAAVSTCIAVAFVVVCISLLVGFKSEISDQEKTISLLKQEITNLSDINDEKNDTIKDQENSANEKDQQIEDLENDVEDKEQQHEEDAAKIEALQKENEELKELLSKYITNDLYSGYAARSSGIATEGEAEWLTASQEIKELKESVAEVFADDAQKAAALIASIDEQAAELQDYYDRIPNFRPAAGETTSPFGYRKHPILGYTKFHYGVDLSKDDGRAVYAAGKGVVTMVKWNDSYGWYIEIDHGNGLKTRYAHLKSKKTCLVAVGDEVEKGENIATMGTTGLSTGVHLHFEVLEDGDRIDPADFIGTY